MKTTMTDRQFDSTCSYQMDVVEYAQVNTSELEDAIKDAGRPIGKTVVISAADRKRMLDVKRNLVKALKLIEAANRMSDDVDDHLDSTLDNAETV
jgi:hypothetical protein